MYCVPARILNDIARTQPLRTKWARRVFALDQESLMAVLQIQSDEMEARRVPNSVILAYQSMALLLAENGAISNYIVATDRLDLRSVLPEIVSAREAVFVADGDYRLSDDEKEQLAGMLAPLDPWADVEDEPPAALPPNPLNLWPVRVAAKPAPTLAANPPEHPIVRLAAKLDASPDARRLLMEAVAAAAAAERVRGE